MDVFGYRPQVRSSSLRHLAHPSKSSYPSVPLSPANASNASQARVHHGRRPQLKPHHPLGGNLPFTQRGRAGCYTFRPLPAASPTACNDQMRALGKTLLGCAGRLFLVAPDLDR
jgi:hypothetical protein